MRAIPEEIRTERLWFHKHRLDEVTEQFKVLEQERGRLEQWIPWVSKVLTEHEMRRRVETTHTDWENRALFDFTLKTIDGEFIGHAGLYRCDWSVPKVEVGYWLTGKAEGKGYLQEAVQALENECFKLGVERLEVRCDPMNVRSSNVARKLGYKLEGTLLRNIRIGGKLLDTEVWAKLRSHKNDVKVERPSFIGHWKEFFDAADWSYPDSTEPMGRGSPVGRKLGLVKIGVHIEMLEPGRRTSWPHAERDEEEFAYVIEGNPDVWIDGKLYRLGPGDFVAFPSGTGIAHTFINNSDYTCQLVVGGQASVPGNKIHYPLHPERNKARKAQGDWWEDVPKRELGPHNGMPDKLLD